MTEMETIELNDIFADLAVAMQHFGTTLVVEGFREHYPKHFEELLLQMQRKQTKIPLLLKR